MNKCGVLGVDALQTAMLLVSRLDVSAEAILRDVRSAVQQLQSEQKEE